MVDGLPAGLHTLLPLLLFSEPPCPRRSDSIIPSHDTDKRIDVSGVPLLFPHQRQCRNAPPVPGSYPPHIPPPRHRYASMFGYPFYPGIAAPGYPGMAAQQQHHGFTPFQSGTAYPGTPMLPPGMLPPVMPVQGSLDPPQQLRPQAPSQQPGA